MGVQDSGDLFGLHRKEVKFLGSAGPFRGIQYIIGCRKLSEDKSTEIQFCTQPWENDVSFVQTSSLNIALQLKKYLIIAFGTLQNVDIGEELYKYYSPEYSFLEL